MRIVLASATAIAVVAPNPIAQSNGIGRGGLQAATYSANENRPQESAQHTKNSRSDWLKQDDTRSPLANCPPELAKKETGCNPPTQIDSRYAERSIFGYDYRPALFGLTQYGNGNYYLREGYLVQYDNNGISDWIPLPGGALTAGNQWPAGYSSYTIPDCYIDYYSLGGHDRYRYADHVIYRIDPADGTINSIAAVVTGDEITVGQQMPAGYDVYNVPRTYRDRYYDLSRAHYRYSDGHIYQIDPETQRVTAVIELLV